MARIAAVQMLLDGVIDLRNHKRLHLQQLLKEVVDRLPPPAVAVEDGLCAPGPLRSTNTRP